MNSGPHHFPHAAPVLTAVAQHRSQVPNSSDRHQALCNRRTHRSRWSNVGPEPRSPSILTRVATGAEGAGTGRRSLGRSGAPTVSDCVPTPSPPYSSHLAWPPWFWWTKSRSATRSRSTRPSQCTGAVTGTGPGYPLRTAPESWRASHKAPGSAGSGAEMSWSSVPPSLRSRWWSWRWSVRGGCAAINGHCRCSRWH